MLLLNGILLNIERQRRRISPTAECSMCGRENESALHMLLDCSDAKGTWESLLRYGGEEGYVDISLSLTDWVTRNISSKVVLGSGVHWCTLFGIGCWQIWKKRCGFIFKGERLSVDWIISLISSIVRKLEGARMAKDAGSSAMKFPTSVSWNSPMQDSFKLNTDASLAGGSGSAFAGGLIRDYAGSWRYGFVVNIGVCSILVAEIWCLFYGLQLARSLGIQKLKVESDSFVGVSMIRGASNISINCRSIVQRVQGLLSDFDSVEVRHVHREGNFAADFFSYSLRPIKIGTLGTARFLMQNW